MQKAGTQCQLNHVEPNVDALFVVTHQAHQAAPSHEPAKGSLHDPASELRREDKLPFQLAHRLNREVQVSSPLHQRPAAVGRIAKQII